MHVVLNVVLHVVADVVGGTFIHATGLNQIILMC